MKVHVMRTPLAWSRKVWCLREKFELCYLSSTHAILLLVFYVIFSYWHILLKTFQIIHWRVHKEECERFAEQMRRIDVLSQFPFTFLEPPALVLLCTYCFVPAKVYWVAILASWKWHVTYHKFQCLAP